MYLKITIKSKLGGCLLVKNDEEDDQNEMRFPLRYNLFKGS